MTREQAQVETPIGSVPRGRDRRLDSRRGIRRPRGSRVRSATRAACTTCSPRTSRVTSMRSTRCGGAGRDRSSSSWCGRRCAKSCAGTTISYGELAARGRRAGRRARGRHRERDEPDLPGDPVPPRDPHRRRHSAATASASTASAGCSRTRPSPTGCSRSPTPRPRAGTGSAAAALGARGGSATSEPRAPLWPTLAAFQRS